MRKCELCDFPANLYCKSDEANLCWKCDTKVHSANFLAAKHTRTLICHVCKSTTSLHVSGSRFGPGTSICHGCIIKLCRLRNDGIPKMGETHREEECSSNFCSNNIGEEDEEEKVGKYKTKFCQREKRKKSAKLGSKSQDVEGNYPVSRQQNNNGDSSNESGVSISRPLKDHKKKLKSRSSNTMDNSLKENFELIKFL